MSKISFDDNTVTVKEFEKMAGLTVGGSLDLRGTVITALPDGLTVSGSRVLRLDIGAGVLAI